MLKFRQRTAREGNTYVFTRAWSPQSPQEMQRDIQKISQKNFHREPLRRRKGSYECMTVPCLSLSHSSASVTSKELIESIVWAAKVV